MYFAIDYETTGFNPYKGDKIFSYIYTDKNLKSMVYRLDNTSKKKNARNLERLKGFHTNTNIIKIAHNAKFEMGFTSQLFDGTVPDSQWHDTIIMSQFLNNLLPSHKLEYLSKKYLSSEFSEESERWDYYDKEVKSHLTKQKRLMNNHTHRVEKEIMEPMLDDGITPLVTERPNYGLVPRNIMEQYQLSDGERCMLLFLLFQEDLISNHKMYLDYCHEIELIRVAQKMEQRGMMIHEQNCIDLCRQYEKELRSIQKQKLKLFKKDVNLDSAPQLQKELFGKKSTLKLKPLFLTPRGQPSASKESIIEMKKLNAHPVFDMILKYRAYSKGITNIKSYVELAGENKIIHPSINTNQARTGRQSVSNPNLQNVSKDFSVNTVYGVPARKCFRPRPGYVYFLGDYAGIEMRLIIDGSGEQELIDRFQEDWMFDCHTFNAELILGKEFSNIQDSKKFKHVRADIKNATFGRAYGANLQTFAKAIRKTSEEAKPGWERFANRCPNIFNFTRSMMEQVRKQGYITSAFGRDLRVEKEKAYTASNYKIQGDAAGILKRAQTNTDKYIDDVFDGDLDKASMILTVHDEIIFELHRSLLRDKYEILNDVSWCMTNMEEIKVPLVTEWKMSTTNWQEAEDFVL